MKIKSLIFFLLLFFTFNSFAQKDTPGSEDHPLITRYPGAYIDWYDVQKYMQYHIATGKYSGYRQIDKWVEAHGKVTRIYYVVKGEATLSEVFQNYQNSIQRAGFEMLAKGLYPQRNVGKEPGGGSWNATAFSKNPLPPNGKIKLFTGSSTSGGTAYLAGKLEAASGNTYVVLCGHQYSTDENVFQLDIIEEAPLDDGKIQVDPDYIAREIERNGTVSLYGILFDFDKTNIKPESKETLDIVAEYLQKNPSVELYIVGHTDMKGSLKYNLDLAKGRAESVVKALVNDYKIATSRLESQGVGPLAPKSNNASEDGQKLNRRVELVKKN